MVQHITEPVKIEAAGTGGKVIKEFFGRVNTRDEKISIAQMESPAGWGEPGQKPQFDEYTLVLNGTLKVETKSGTFLAGAGEAILCPKNEWVRYSTPDGAKYLAVCLTAFSPETVHRDAQ